VQVAGHFGEGGGRLLRGDKVRKSDVARGEVDLRLKSSKASDAGLAFLFWSLLACIGLPLFWLAPYFC
jgi:hypothetical protein